MKRYVGIGAVLLGTLISATLLSTSSAQTELRLGYQRGDFATVMIEQRLLENRFGKDVTVTWTLFTSGPPTTGARRGSSTATPLSPAPSGGAGRSTSTPAACSAAS